MPMVVRVALLMWYSKVIDGETVHFRQTQKMVTLDWNNWEGEVEEQIQLFREKYPAPRGPGTRARVQYKFEGIAQVT